MAGFGGGGAFGQPATGGGGLSFGGFGTPAALTTTPSTGFNFGGFGGGPQPTSTTAPTGFSLGGFGSTPSTTSAANTGFAFGTPSTGFGSFGAPATTASTGFSFGGFGTTTTSAGSGFGFGTSSTAAAPGGGFGFMGFGTGGAPGAQTGSGTSGFTFGGLNTAGTGGGLGLGGSGALGGGGQAGGAGLFAKPSGMLGAAAPPVSADANLSNLMAALFCPVLYGDERDNVIAKWNQLQAFWGTGKGYFAIGAPPVEFSLFNPFCRFKAVGYSCLPTSKNEEGLVSLIFNRKDVEIRANQPQVVDGLQRVLGSRPTLLVCVEGVKPSIDNKSEVTIFVLERSQAGASRRIPTTELSNYFAQANVRQQLTMLGVEAVVPKVVLASEQLTQYLDNPPAGVDPLVWHQARLDNPDPERLIPVPMVGFAELQRRLKCQEEETKMHQGRLDMISGEISTLQNNHLNTVAKISEQKRKHLELSRRILKVMVRQEIGRKFGLAVQADEEQLRTQLEVINTELSAPNQAKGRLNELMSQIRLQKEYMLAQSTERYSIEPAFQKELKQHLMAQQNGLAHLVNVLREDLECLKMIEVGLRGEAVRQRS